MTERQIQFSASISNCLAQLFDDESHFAINIDVADEEQVKDFIWALSTTVPCNMWSKISGNKINFLEFNHIANMLCFENMTMKNEE
jgi:hypothetical protein